MLYDRGELTIRVQENLVNGDFPRVEALLESQLATLGDDDPDREVLERARLLAVAGRHVVQLDAEDFPVADRCLELSDSTRKLLRQASAPRAAGDPRGQVTSLNGALRILLEVLQLHYCARQPDRVVAILHLLGEYLPLLVWQGLLGNAGEPQTVDAHLRQGDPRWVRRRELCPRGLRPYVIHYAALRVRDSAPGDDEAWRAYVKDRRSVLADLLESCTLCAHDDLAGTRPVAGAPCGIAPVDAGARERAVRMASVRTFKRSEPILQRHHSPQGHSFSVPSREEIDMAWETAARDVVATPGCPLTTEDLADGYVLPGLRALLRYWGDLQRAPEPSDVVVEIGTAIQDLLEVTRAGST